MRLKDAASCSFDCFNIDLKERPDETVSSIDLQRSYRRRGPNYGSSPYVDGPLMDTSGFPACAGIALANGALKNQANSEDQ